MAAVDPAVDTNTEPTEGDDSGIDVEALKEEHAKELDRYRNQVGQANKTGEEQAAQIADLTAKLKAQTEEGQTAEERANTAAEERISGLEKQLESLTTDATASKTETIAGRRKMALSAAGVTAENSATMARLLEGSTDEELTAEVEALKTSFPAAFTEPDAPAPRGASSPPGRPGVKPKPVGDAVHERLKEIRDDESLTPAQRKTQRIEAWGTPPDE